MTRIRILGTLGALVMLATIAHGLSAGSFADEGAVLLDLAWGRVTLIDLYLSFLAFWGWVVLRERSWPVRLGWLIAIATLGSLAVYAYVVVAATGSRGDRRRFLLGRLADD